MVGHKGISMYLSWLLVLVLQLVSSSAGLNYTVVPQNVTINNGKSATFRCGVLQDNNTTKISFIVQCANTNYSLTCPGNPSSFPVLSLYGQCVGTFPTLTASWDISNVGGSVNGSIFRCHVDGLSDKAGYLWINESSSYYAMLFGCVMGGFFGILIVFGVSYVLLKRSERLQNCFRGKPEDDEVTVVETSKEY